MASPSSPARASTPSAPPRTAQQPADSIMPPSYAAGRFARTPRRRSSVGRTLIPIVLGIGALIAYEWPELRRYLKIRSM